MVPFRVGRGNGTWSPFAWVGCFEATLHWGAAETLPDRTGRIVKDLYHLIDNRVYI
jgi:hypothetical protein